ncbi:MAG: hypothetical protein ACTH4U_04545 [Pseudoalteromonas prydzensis]|uniref:hypothetical protein n=1 Tax=Pseudoalteromonas prydzensis TaxID=182141 RepID=UPI003F96EC15
MKVEDLSVSDSIPKLKYSLACAVAVVSSVISYSSLAFTILIMLWPYNTVNELGPRVIVFFIGICIFIALGALLSAGRYWVIKVYTLVAGCAIFVSLIYVLGFIFKREGELSFNGVGLSVVFIVLNSVLMLFFKSKHLKVSVNVIKRLKRRQKKQMEYLKSQL